MAYLLTHFWPGGTEEQYRATLAVVHPPNGLPDGQIYHAAGPTEGGFLIAAVWDSKQSSDRFVSGVATLHRSVRNVAPQQSTVSDVLALDGAVLDLAAVD